MVSMMQIGRLIEVGAYQRLIERILSNGRCDSPEARRRLGEGGNARLAALGLALQRHCELAYGPSAAGRDFAEMLCDELEHAAGAAASAPAEPGTLAAAARGLLDWQALQGGRQPVETRPIDGWIDSVLSYLGALQDDDGLIAGDPAESALVLWQLGERADQAQRLSHVIDLQRLRVAVSRAASGGSSALCRFAFAVAA